MASPASTCLALVSALAGLAFGSFAPQSQSASERTGGALVDFIAVEADGTPVADLQRGDVEIRIGDRVRSVRSLRRINAAPPPGTGTMKRLPVPYGTNADVAAGRSFVLIVDQESFAAGHESLLRSAVEGLLAELTPADKAMVAALPFGGIKIPFTSDVGRIRLAIDAVTGQGSRAETGSELACRTRRFLESLDGFLHEYSSRRTPLTVVLFTAGLAGPRRDAPMALAPGMCELVVEDFRRIALTASAARANFYVAQPADVGIGAQSSRETIAGGNFLGSDNPLEGIEHLAGVTNGARVPLDAAGTDSLLRVARESSAYYVAELEPVANEPTGRSRSLSVRAVRRGITVRARPAITFNPPPAQPRATRIAVTDLLASPDPFPDLALRVGGFTVREPDGRLRVGVVIEPAETAVSLASAGAILVAGDGRVMARWFAKDPADRPLLGAMSVPAGTYTLRAAAVDGEGRTGAAEEIADVGLVRVGSLSLGSLLLGVSRNEGTTPRLEFGAEPTAIASFDIYDGAPGLSLTARLEIARDDSSAPLAAVPLALTRAGEGRVVAMGAVPLGALPPGDYLVRGIIRLEDGTTGRVTRTLRKTLR